jgi:hypothetical protein
LVWLSLLPETSTSFSNWAEASAIRVAEKEGLLGAIVEAKTQDSKKEKIRRGKAESLTLQESKICSRKKLMPKRVRGKKRPC